MNIQIQTIERYLSCGYDAKVCPTVIQEATEERYYLVAGLFIDRSYAEQGGTNF